MRSVVVMVNSITLPRERCLPTTPYNSVCCSSGQCPLAWGEVGRGREEVRVILHISTIVAGIGIELE